MGGFSPVRRKGGGIMIHQDKLKVMTQMALYEKKKSKKDFSIYSYQRGDYVWSEIIKTIIAVTVAFVIILGFIAAWNFETIITHFENYDYKQIGLVVVIAYLCMLIFYMKLTSNKSREEYNEVRPRVRRYFRGLKKMKSFYAEEDKVQKEFEKGEWRDGQ